LIRQPNRLFHNDAQERGNLQKHLLTRIGDIRIADALQNRIHVNVPRTDDRYFVLQRWRSEARFIIQPQLAAPRQSIVVLLQMPTPGNRRKFRRRLRDNIVVASGVIFGFGVAIGWLLRVFWNC
jgi:hypothetical protein